MALTLSLVSTLKKTPKNNYHIILIDDKNQPISGLPADLNEAVNQLITVSCFQGKLGATALAYANEPQDGLLLVGIGTRTQPQVGQLQKIAKAIYNQLSQLTKSATLILADYYDDNAFGQLALALLNQSYVFDCYKSKKADDAKLTEIRVWVTDTQHATLQNVLLQQHAIYKGQALAKDLANQPPNTCVPQYLTQKAQQLANQYPALLTLKVVGEKDMEKLGMHCFLAVAKGSVQEAQLILLEYNGSQPDTKTTTKPTKKTKNKAAALENPSVMVGKGITFDSGGISLKPGLGMGEMKYDMGGAAAVLGMMQALCEARLPLQVVGALACAENMPSGQATRPGDIVTAMNGTTVEILNTDAEGRLVLCDTLVYVQRYQPQVIIDMATLTGACVVALGHVRTGMYSNNEDVIFDLEQASSASQDRVWHMPLDDDYQEQLNSNMADMQNIGGMPAGSVTAACFLSRFVGDIPWAHLDIAGTAWQSGKEPTATGRPVPLLMHYLQRKALQA